MNRIIKSTMFAVMALCAISCSDWTEQETVGFEYNNLDKTNPALYQKYLEGIRTYRASNHQVMIARIDNVATVPVGRAEHLNAIPDSVDYIVLNSAVVSDIVLAEAATLRETKAQKTLLSIDFAAIDKAYNLYKEELEEGVEPMSEEAYIDAAVQDFLKVYDATKLDGILASYNGKNPASMPEDEYNATVSLQTAFFAPLVAKISGDKTFLFAGNARNIITDVDVLGTAKYIIVPVESKTSGLAIDNVVLDMIAPQVPTDKFIAGVAALDITDKQATDGLFSGESSAAVGAAYWASTPSADFTKCGVCVNHAQFDYYHIGADYCEIRKAISVMNPSPIK